MTDNTEQRAWSVVTECQMSGTAPPSHQDVTSLRHETYSGGTSEYQRTMCSCNLEEHGEETPHEYGGRGRGLMFNFCIEGFWENHRKPQLIHLGEGGIIQRSRISSPSNTHVCHASCSSSVIQTSLVCLEQW